MGVVGGITRVPWGTTADDHHARLFSATFAYGLNLAAGAQWQNAVNSQAWAGPKFGDLAFDGGMNLYLCRIGWVYTSANADCTTWRGTTPPLHNCNTRQGASWHFCGKNDGWADGSSFCGSDNGYGKNSQYTVCHGSWTVT